MMTSRERVLEALDHKPTDRAPMDYGAHQDVTARLIEKLGVTDLDELLVALGVDMRRINFGFRQPQTGPDSDGYMLSMWGVKELVEDTGNGSPTVIRPFNEDSTVEEVHTHTWPDANKLDYSGIKADCEKYAGKYALFGAPWSPFFHDVGWLIGQEDFMVWMHTNPDLVHAIIGHIVDYEVEVTRLFLEAAEGLIDIAYFGNDFGTQRGPFISPEMWQEFIRKPLKRFYDTAHDAGCKVMQHSCGAIRNIIPSLIEDGVDILDPIQTAATGMDLAGLVQDFGGQISFHGGVDTQHTLPFGSEEDVRAEVRSYLELTKEHGGYILASSQEYIQDIPLDNILAIYDENQKS
jgi:uroporphyrinogen decarboxylase